VAGLLDGLHELGLPEGEVNGAAVRMGFVPHYFDPTRARAELGLPSTPVEQAFSDAWDWFRSPRATGGAVARTRVPGHRARA
jgi:hypothetical protein